MKRLLLSTVAVLALAGAARADVVLQDKLSGTGDNVVFDSVSTNSAIGHLNGQHLDLVDFTDLTGSTTFTAATSGNDIKITGSNNLFIQVFDPTNSFVISTLEQVFSLKGTGDVTAFVQAVDKNGVAEAIKSFDLGTIDPNAQSGFTFTASNGEVMTSLRLLDLSGNIAEFEHYRIDVGPNVAAVPELSTWAMMGLGFLGVGLLGLRKRRSSFRFA